MDKASDAAAAFERSLALEPGFADGEAKLQIAQERARSLQLR
jgi:hypothetical protein